MTSLSSKGTNSSAYISENGLDCSANLLRAASPKLFSCSTAPRGETGDAAWSTGKIVSSRPLLEFKVRGCRMLGADDVRDGFDNVHLKLFC